MYRVIQTNPVLEAELQKDGSWNIYDQDGNLIDRLEPEDFYSDYLIVDVDD